MPVRPFLPDGGIKFFSNNGVGDWHHDSNATPERTPHACNSASREEPVQLGNVVAGPAGRPANFAPTNPTSASSFAADPTVASRAA
ncbi:hypothetical protein GN244_ATG05853 [Phytophthora infestans]|uniref:Uncharacterized protein n=1 Tax=Phytophthora infestans TaxID=4787 RepID=A0A833S6R4_PHYIN|nr:hypothetical protein GN244_ATG05853 [Phytophthora infestans]KAF4130755.1 hypothetical protein GN958_ATG20060 [Phytophthora infestans]